MKYYEDDIVEVLNKAKDKHAITVGHKYRIMFVHENPYADKKDAWLLKQGEDLTTLSLMHPEVIDGVSSPAGSVLLYYRPFKNKIKSLFGAK